MCTALTLPAPFVGMAIVAGGLAALLGAILPTCLYLYVEPRGRRQWAAEGDAPAKRRAPGIVRLTAWLSFAIGQLALPWLLVPGACAVLLYLQTKLGIIRPIGMAATAGIGAAAVLQAVMAARLWPLGVKLLMRDARICSTITQRSRTTAVVSVALLGGASVLGWAMATIPNFVHPWLRAALVWTALRPVMAYAVVCLAHAMLLRACCKAMGANGAVGGDGSDGNRRSV
jgi:hypothetical protein